jgi:urease accessory protein
MVADAEQAREGRRVLALSRTDAASVATLSAWVRELLVAHRAGTHSPQDPGPMAPHFHADENGGVLHSHDHDHTDGHLHSNG